MVFVLTCANLDQIHN